MPIQRFLLAAAAAAVAGLTFAAPVSAKVPYFSVELEPTNPVAGEPITVTVRFWDDAAHTQPSTWGPHESVEDLVGFVPVGGDAGDAVFVPLESAGPDAVRGTVTLSSGMWMLTAWPRTVEELPPGYPDPVSIEVAAPGSPIPLAVASASAVAFLAAGVVLARRGQRLVRSRHHRS